MRDYTGKTIYLGMDVHKLSYSVTAICEGEVVKRDRLNANCEELLKYCQKYFRNAEIISAYEAGFCGFSLHRFLIKNGIKNIVVHPASIETQINDRVKTDKKDSLKIAVHLSQNRLKGVYVPSVEQEANRSISRFRATYIRERTRCVNRLKGFFNYLGIALSFNRMSQTALKNLRKLDLGEDLNIGLNLLLDQWEMYSKYIKICDARLKQQSSKNSLDKYYISVPGIGRTIGKVLTNELGDMSQFSNEKQLFSYCGLTPTEYSSGEKVRKGHISRQGKSCLRMYLTQAAWVAIRKDSNLRESFERISQKAGSKRAIQGIARKLIGRVRSCIKNQKIYEKNR